MHSLHRLRDGLWFCGELIIPNQWAANRMQVEADMPKVRIPTRHNGEVSQRDRILASLERAASVRTKKPTKAELDRQIQEERDSWE